MPRRRAEPPLDPFERAARRVDPQYAVLAEAAAPPRSLRAPRLLLYFGVLVVVAALAKRGGDDPSLTKSCTTPGFAIGSTSVEPGAPVRWSVTGPASDHVVLGLDDAATPPTSPLAGPRQLAGCLVHGAFRAPESPGEHTVTAFVVTPRGSATARLSETFTVH
ncbi:MAG: hypothetical protein ABR549_11935 [Mycobacteriales bacterium]